jgi:hypothetical protein
LKRDAGRLWVCTAPSCGRRNIVGATVKILLGRDDDNELDAFETDDFCVELGTLRINVSTDARSA